MAPKPITVSQLNSYIKRVLQTDPILGSVFVIGEISNLKYHDSGHVYFSLKDAAGKINCFLAASYADLVDIPLQDGMEIVAAGGISVFERGGYYSLNVREISELLFPLLAQLVAKIHKNEFHGLSPPILAIKVVLRQVVIVQHDRIRLGGVAKINGSALWGK